MRYYYDDPIKAAWQAKEHKIAIFLNEFVCVKEKHAPRTDGSNTYITECEEWVQCYTRDDAVIVKSLQDRFYIHPDCYEPLKPRVGDIGLSKSGEIGQYNGDCWIRGEGCNDYGGGYHMDECPTIIWRDNKAWFEPEAEE